MFVKEKNAQNNSNETFWCVSVCIGLWWWQFGTDIVAGEEVVQHSTPDSQWPNGKVQMKKNFEGEGYKAWHTVKHWGINN